MIFQRHPKRKLAAIYAGGLPRALVRVGLANAFPLTTFSTVQVGLERMLLLEGRA